MFRQPRGCTVHTVLYRYTGDRSVSITENLADHPPPDQTAEPPLTRPVVTPELYSGTESRSRDWLLTTFELGAELNGGSSDVRQQFLVVRLRGLAREIYDSFDDVNCAD